MNASNNILFSVYSDTCKPPHLPRKNTPHPPNKKKREIHFVLVKIVQFMTKNNQ